jgi:hypothetical protein
MGIERLFRGGKVDRGSAPSNINRKNLPTLMTGVDPPDRKSESEPVETRTWQQIHCDSMNEAYKNKNDKNGEGE